MAFRSTTLHLHTDCRSNVCTISPAANIKHGPAVTRQCHAKVSPSKQRAIDSSTSSNSRCKQIWRMNKNNTSSPSIKLYNQEGGRTKSTPVPLVTADVNKYGGQKERTNEKTKMAVRRIDKRITHAILFLSGRPRPFRQQTEICAQAEGRLKTLGSARKAKVTEALTFDFGGSAFESRTRLAKSGDVRGFEAQSPPPPPTRQAVDLACSCSERATTRRPYRRAVIRAKASTLPSNFSLKAVHYMQCAECGTIPGLISAQATRRARRRAALAKAWTPASPRETLRFSVGSADKVLVDRCRPRSRRSSLAESGRNSLFARAPYKRLRTLLELLYHVRAVHSLPVAALHLVSSVSRGGLGGAAAKELASHQGKPGSIPGGVAPGFSQVGRCRRSEGFLGDIPFPPPLHSGAAPYSPRFSLIGFPDHAVKNHPSIFTPPLIRWKSYVTDLPRTGLAREDSLSTYLCQSCGKVRAALSSATLPDPQRLDDTVTTSTMITPPHTLRLPKFRCCVALRRFGAPQPVFLS
ncbi:hypothetical protein PR048_011922 [Dryococelus australis]|uniref:Uncharacterized protein n=1 Tax=Dryococelus australis TaxID=614101 RepID=A0ABQ9HN05_9NEOP|nr:hypothetical protein PR048_011922 [Dryococelus australis]